MWLPRNFPPFFSPVSRQRLRLALTSRMPTVIWVGRRSGMATVVSIGARTIFSSNQYPDPIIIGTADELNKPPGNRVQVRGFVAGRLHDMSARGHDVSPLQDVRVMIGPRPAAIAVAVVAALLLLGDRQAARGQEHPAAAAMPAAATCQRSAFRVVVDVGHTVDVPGALSSRGIPEYAFNLQLAQEAKQALVDDGFTSAVLLVTATAPWRGLFERAAKANSMNADLFLAIHHDSVPDNLMRSWQYEGQD